VNPVTKTTGEGQPEDALDVRTFLHEHLPGFFSQDVMADLEARLDLGERKYGYALKVGWAEARQELYQEVLDAVLYAVAAQDMQAVYRLTPVVGWLQLFPPGDTSGEKK
jgi:hypothetical protein